MATFAGLTYTNGNVPASLLRPLDGENFGNAVLRRDAAESWNRARTDVEARTGIVLTVRGWNRSLAEQERFFFERYERQATGTGLFGDVRWYQGVRYVRTSGAPAAIPGTSNHGWGTTVDVVDFGAYGTDGNDRRDKAMPILRKHGWTDDEGQSISEPWHIEYVPTRDTHPTVQEDDMTFTAAHADQLDDLHRLLLRKFTDGDQPIDIVDGVGRVLTVARRTEADVSELHAGVAPRIDKTAETNAEKVTFRTAIKEIRLAVTGGLNATVTNAVENALADVPGVDPAKVSADVVSAILATLPESITIPLEN